MHTVSHAADCFWTDESLCPEGCEEGEVGVCVGRAGCEQNDDEFTCADGEGDNCTWRCNPDNPAPSPPTPAASGDNCCVPEPGSAWTLEQCAQFGTWPYYSKCTDESDVGNHCDWVCGDDPNGGGGDGGSGNHDDDCPDGEEGFCVGNAGCEVMHTEWDCSAAAQDGCAWRCQPVDDGCSGDDCGGDAPPPSGNGDDGNHVPCPAPCPGDINGDGTVSTADMLSILGQYGQTGPNWTADLNCDGAVNANDLLVFLTNMGNDC